MGSALERFQLSIEYSRPIVDRDKSVSIASIILLCPGFEMSDRRNIRVSITYPFRKGMTEFLQFVLFDSLLRFWDQSREESLVRAQTATQSTTNVRSKEIWQQFDDFSIEEGFFNIFKS